MATKAIVTLRPEGGSGVAGFISFEQPTPYGPVTIQGHVTGLTPDAERGIHIHQWGDLSKGCDSAGPHFNPYNKDHGGPHDEIRHVGDLGNLRSNGKGEAWVSFKDSVISLSGPDSIIGRSVVVHQGTDDLGRGTGQSKLNGNSGPRAACGIIGLAIPV